MSRQLPARPNLDHLRNQAKDLLQSARTHHPTWQLADAQHALARGYGYSSWPALKAHVDALVAEAGEPATAHVGASDDHPNRQSLLAGAWVADVERSSRHPAFQFRSASLDIRISGARITMTQVVIDADGDTSGSTMTIAADGQLHPVPGASHGLVAQWIDERTLEAIDMKDNHEMARGRYEVSPDGRELTVTTAEQRLVFDRA
jgi:hypothetical protein